MTQATEQGIFRVTVKGKFVELTDQAQRYLVDNAADHTYFKSAYTTEGTFVYDADAKFFNLRYEVRCGGEDPGQAAHDLAMAEAQTFLKTMDFGYTKLRASVVDMSSMSS